MSKVLVLDADTSAGPKDADSNTASVTARAAVSTSDNAAQPGRVQGVVSARHRSGGCRDALGDCKVGVGESALEGDQRCGPI